MISLKFARPLKYVAHASTREYLYKCGRVARHVSGDEEVLLYGIGGKEYRSKPCVRREGNKLA